MAERITVTEAARNFAEYLNRVAYRRESFLLVRGNKPVAELRPVATCRRLGDLPAMIASLPRLTPEEAGAFTEDVEQARSESERIGLSDPWER